jgi:equilibrative nucleoside transporter 1/2/3
MSQSPSQSPSQSFQRGSQGRTNSAEVLISLLEGDNPTSDTSALSFDKIWAVYRQILVPSLSVFFVFTMTIGIFPSLIVLLESEDKCRSSSRFSNDLYVPFFFLLFNLFDLIGRVTGGATQPLFTSKNVWMAALARTVFVPLFLLCNVSNSQLPVLFKSDIFPIVFMAFMAFSNGYTASLCMMMGASAVSVQDAPIAGTIMILSLTVGLFMGAAVSFLVVIFSQGSV